MSIQDQIEQATDTFVDPNSSPVEKLELWPRGSEENKIPFWGVWDADSLPGTNQTLGDGRILNSSDARSDRQSVFIEMPNRPELPVQDPQPRLGYDIIKRLSTTQQCRVKRIMGQDVGMVTVLGVDHRHITKRRGSQSG